MFLNEGPPMAALLRSAGSQGHSPEYVKRLLVAFGAEAVQGAVMDPLSERELQVLSLMGEGYTNREIAEELVIGISTVKTHINRIFSKMDVTNRTQAVIMAREKGLV
jgi:LuxR family maltose regulon positive regulatory protein